MVKWPNTQTAALHHSNQESQLTILLSSHIRWIQDKCIKAMPATYINISFLLVIKKLHFMFFYHNELIFCDKH